MNQFSINPPAIVSHQLSQEESLDREADALLARVMSVEKDTMQIAVALHDFHKRFVAMGKVGFFGYMQKRGWSQGTIGRYLHIGAALGVGVDPKGKTLADLAALGQAYREGAPKEKVLEVQTSEQAHLLLNGRINVGLTSIKIPKPALQHAQTFLGRLVNLKLASGRPEALQLILETLDGASDQAITSLFSIAQGEASLEEQQDTGEGEDVINQNPETPIEFEEELF